MTHCFGRRFGEAYAQHLADDWIDAASQVDPDARVYTSRKYSGNSFARDAELRMITSPEPKRSALVDAGVDRAVRGWETASDLAPVWVDLKVNRRSR